MAAGEDDNDLSEVLHDLNQMIGDLDACSAKINQVVQQPTVKEDINLDSCSLFVDGDEELNHISEQIPLIHDSEHASQAKVMSFYHKIHTDESSNEEVVYNNAKTGPTKSSAHSIQTGPMAQDSKQNTGQVNINVHCADQSIVTLSVGCDTTAGEACMKIVIVNSFKDSPLWVLVECIPDLGLERNLEDHESVLPTFNTWAPDSKNKFLFRRDPKKYDFFMNTENYFPPHLLDSECSDKATTERAQQAKKIILQNLLSTCNKTPELAGTLNAKDFSKKSWNKKFFMLRGSGLYCSNKGKSKASKDLESYVQFDGANLYSIMKLKKAQKAPTEFCFCVVPLRAKELKEIKCLSADDEKTMLSWMMGIRLAKHGSRLRCNYDNMIRKFVKLQKLKGAQPSSDLPTNKTADEKPEATHVGTQEHRVPMDFTGAHGKVMDNVKEIEALAKERPKVRLSTRPLCSQSFVPCQTSMSGSISHESWYHGRVTREHVLNVLKEEGLEDGLFLVRESSSVEGVFVLTFCLNKKVYHCQLVEDIGEGTQTVVSVGKGPAFPTLSEFIHHYQQKPVNGVTLALRRPCPKRDCS